METLNMEHFQVIKSWQHILSGELMSQQILLLSAFVVIAVVTVISFFHLDLSLNESQTFRNKELKSLAWIRIIHSLSDRLAVSS
ncbi:MAG: hypothetical protein JHC73_21285 [Dolichospermum sp.]|nr:hypothetical protein [Dolichospermum sp.]